MPASRIIALALAIAVVAVGGVSAAYILFANANSDSGLHLIVSVDARATDETDYIRRMPRHSRVHGCSTGSFLLSVVWPSKLPRDCITVSTVP